MAREQGVDNAVYQGPKGTYGQASDKFLIAQIGGTYGGRINRQSTYASQVLTAKSKGIRAHAYIWFQVGGSQSIAKAALDYFLPQIKLPRGAIVALDYEAGASSSKSANTNAVLYGMKRIRDYGYTPMYYSYKPYTDLHIYADSVVKQFGNESLWIAKYPYSVAISGPDYRYFPSMNGVGIWQFTDKYNHSGGLDGNVDVTGVTKNGYGRTTNVAAKPSVTTTKKVEVDDMPKAKWRSTTTVGLAYARDNAVIYQDSELTKPKLDSKGKSMKLQSEMLYKVFNFENGAVDLGKAWVSELNLWVVRNPLVFGNPADVKLSKPITLNTGRTIQPGNYRAFGVSLDGKIDLGNYQTADASDFLIYM